MTCNDDCLCKKCVEKIIDSNLKSIKSKVEKYKNTLVLFSFEVCELLDWVDGKDDYYWIYNDSRVIKWYSCVGGFIPLIEYLPKDIYDSLYRIWGYNNVFNWDGGKEILQQIKENGWRDPNNKPTAEEQELLNQIFSSGE